MHQHQGLHAQYARNADGVKMIELVRREDSWSDNMREFIHRPQHNTNSENIMLNVPANFVQEDTSNDDSGVATAVSVVYVTVPASFSGTVLGYVTATPTASPTDSVDAAPAVATSSAAQVNAASIATSNANKAATPATTALSQTTSASGLTQTPRVGSPVYTSQAASSTADVSNAGAQQAITQSSQDTGLTDGAKAGLAIGIIAAIALFAGLIFFCVRRAKKNHNDEQINEKSGLTEKRSSFFGAGFSAAGKRASADSDKSFGTVHNTTTAPRLSLRPVTQFLPQFGEKRKSGNLLAASGPQMSEKSSAWERRPQNGENPFADASEKLTNPFDEGDGKSVHSKHSLEQASQPGTPQSSQFGAGAVAGEAQRAPNNVHRVQLDFKPSMDDELELKSGQLVRMLHEYDDGWALCVRMDRSQQGVAPRTCLSKLPVKPRGPPPGGRISPQGQMRGPPPTGRMSPQSRPMTPNGQQSPPGNVARKPVPGQAI